MIITREKLSLSNSQLNLVRSGWGAESVDNTILERITYLSDGLKIKGYIAYPKIQHKKYPCVIWCRGGFGNSGALDDFNAQGILGQIASWGYTVLESQYRGNAGGEGKDEFGGKDLNDVLSLIELAEELPTADTSIWGIEGWSRGGMMVYMALARKEIFKAAIISGGITDLQCNASESKFMRYLFKKSFGEIDSDEFIIKCESRSAVTFADKISKSTNLLILHGTNDKRVPPHNSIDLSYKLLENNINFRLILLENGDHFLKPHRKEVDNFRKNWFNKFLIV